MAAARVFLSKHRVEPSLNVSIDRGIRLDLDSDSESEDGPGSVPVKFHGTGIFTYTCTMKIKKMSVNIPVPWILCERVFRIPPQVFAGWSLFFLTLAVVAGLSLFPGFFGTQHWTFSASNDLCVRNLESMSRSIRGVTYCP